MAMRVKYPHFLGVIASPAAAAQAPGVQTVYRDIPRAVLEATLPDWRTATSRNGGTVKTTPYTTADNIRAIGTLTGWQFRHNEMSKRVEVTREGEVIPEDDHENIALTLFGDSVVRAGMSRADVAASVDAVASGNRYHPVKDWITATPWDGVSRRSLWHATLVLTDQRKIAFRNKLMDKWALQGIGALMEERGISSPGILVLGGAQYVGKTYWFGRLCPLPDTVGEGLSLDPTYKDSVLKAVRYWIAELGELDSTTRRADVSVLKAFLSTTRSKNAD
jgi:putative DNA primase/helicase